MGGGRATPPPLGIFFPPKSMVGNEKETTYLSPIRQSKKIGIRKILAYKLEPPIYNKPLFDLLSPPPPLAVIPTTGLFAGFSSVSSSLVDRTVSV